MRRCLVPYDAAMATSYFFVMHFFLIEFLPDELNPAYLHLI